MSKGMETRKQSRNRSFDERFGNFDFGWTDDGTRSFDEGNISWTFWKEERQKEKQSSSAATSFTNWKSSATRVALIKDGRIIDIAVMEDIRNPKREEYKIEFLEKDDFESFRKLPYEFIRIKDDQNQVIIKI